MTALTAIPTAELRDDLAETQADIALCLTARLLDIQDYGGKSVDYRLESNWQIQAVIEAELERRGER